MILIFASILWLTIKNMLSACVAFLPQEQMQSVEKLVILTGMDRLVLQELQRLYPKGENKDKVADQDILDYHTRTERKDAEDMSFNSRYCLWTHVAAVMIMDKWQFKIPATVGLMSANHPVCVLRLDGLDEIDFGAKKKKTTTTWSSVNCTFVERLCFVKSPQFRSRSMSIWEREVSQF